MLSASVSFEGEFDGEDVKRLPSYQQPSSSHQALGAIAFGTALQTYQHPQIHSAASAQGRHVAHPTGYILRRFR
ncbi:hypothetical protein DL767_011346 [Monosporascus sp. MG133]|nr:hypothetical protein DL767_011346 [Monosporascus sp. MG133]